jgi:hypothetical protein
MKTPRYMRDKAALRALLAAPLRADKLPTGTERFSAEKKHTDERIEALFALYDIPEEWPLIDQWEQLARRLAGEHFKGCRILNKGAGGPSEERREKQRELFRQFQYFQLHLSRSSAAVRFVREHRQECRAAGFTAAKSFAEAAARFFRRMDPLKLGLQLTKDDPAK